MIRKPLSPKGSLPSGALSSTSELDAFLTAAKSRAPLARSEGGGRLVFAMDATASRQPTWDLAREIQADLFHAAAELGGLEVKLVYYRGTDECRTSNWVSDPHVLGALMKRIDCRGGLTQISRVLGHLSQEVERSGVKAAVFVGDAMEENPAALCDKAGKLGLMGLRLFMFQEGEDARVEGVFKEMARLSGGAWCRFAPGAGEELRALLRAVAAYAAGGRTALLKAQDAGAVRLLAAMGDRTS
ncbi:VWA domain-containing protein [Aquabacter sp. CN5-332]|uniref:VWA domain-containing protein n=1 Tax=Aquabacter sp. CN5-332 TaxID=3156608 RepID=UPI0032B38FD2